MSHILTYNKLDINKQKDYFYNENIQNGYKLWADLEDLTAEEMYEIHRIFHIDKNVLKQYFKDSQKSQIHIFKDYNFTIIRNMNISSFQILETEPVYLFFNKNWLITIHSSKII